jgi:hypothetical protein
MAGELNNISNDLIPNRHHHYLAVAIHHFWNHYLPVGGCHAFPTTRLADYRQIPHRRGKAYCNRTTEGKSNWIQKLDH